MSYYGRLCQREPVIVTVKGQPAFQMVPFDDDEDLINQLLDGPLGPKTMWIGLQRMGDFAIAWTAFGPATAKRCV